MQQLFRGTNATGSSSYTPSATVRPPSQCDTPPRTQNEFDRTWAFDGFFNPLEETQGEQVPNLNSPTNPPLQQTPPIPPFNQTPPIPPSNQTPTNPPFQQTSRHASRRRRGDTDNMMHDLMGLMQERYIERQNKKSRTNSDSPNTGTSVESTGNSTNYANIVARIQRLAEGGEFDIGEAILFVMEPDKKDVFNVLSDDIAKSWLLSGLAAKRHTQEYQAYLIKQSGANK